MDTSASYNIINENGSSEIVVTKSKFIGSLAPAGSPEEAEDFILSVRKKYKDARHNCWAYIIMGENGLVKKCSDDGEPSGTAGRPMLAVMEGASLVNAVCVVTRYFGGVLLGTGGLVRAYTDAAAQALSSCVLSPIRPGMNLSIVCDYQDEGGIRRLLDAEEFILKDAGYTEKVTLNVLGPEEKAEMLMKRVVDQTGGRAVATPGEKVFY